jgi:hypothetical protein
VTGLWLAAFVALWVLVTFIGLVVLGTLRRVTPLIEAAEAAATSATTASLGGLLVGSRVPAFTAETVDRQVFTEMRLETGRSGVLFLSRSCDACERLADDLARGEVPPDLGVPLIVVSDEATSASEFSRSVDVTVLVDERRVVADAFDVRIVPRAFVVGERRLVLAAGRPNDWDGLRSLISTAEGGDRLADLTTAAVAR